MVGGWVGAWVGEGLKLQHEERVLEDEQPAQHAITSTRPADPAPPPTTPATTLQPASPPHLQRERHHLQALLVQHRGQARRKLAHIHHLEGRWRVQVKGAR